MKLSRYNSYISLGEKAGLIFNAFTDSFVAVKSSSDGFAKVRNGDITSISSELQKQLEEAGAVVADDFDEVDALRKRIDEIDNNDSFLLLHINPTLDCNFRCWYCYENHIKGSCMTPETYGNVVKLVKNRIAKQPNLKYLQLSFFGGEPLLRFDEVVKPLISEIAALCKDAGIDISVHFTSNSHLLTDEMILFLKPHQAGFQITLDGGRENHNKTRFGKGGTPSFDDILTNVRKLAEAELPIGLRINYTAENIESTNEIIEIISAGPDEVKKFVSVDYQRVWQDGDNKNNDPTYAKTRQFRKRLNEAGFRTGNNRILNGVCDSCYGDKRNQLLVNYNGDVFCCTARDFKPEHRMGRLADDGNVVWEGDRFEKRMASKFSKPVCHECRIAPLCGGGCRTQATEHPEPYKCIYGYTADEMDEFIIERFEELHMHQ